MKWGNQWATILWILHFVPEGGLAQPQLSRHSPNLQPGDLLFVNLDCGPLCDAIEAVTTSYNDQKFSHMGMVVLSGDSVLVLEARGEGVRLTPLPKFLSATAHPVYVARLIARHKPLITAAVQFASSHVGVPYDDAYLYNNGRYYCSELIYDAFMAANAGVPFFELAPMTFIEPGSKSYFPVWEAYFKKLEMAIPEGKPGCNPGGISLSPKIEFIGKL